jgi:tRNA dimethylallyltransferase
MKVHAMVQIPNSRQKAILIAGPTASGKSALAVALARELGGLVINADSMQVYQGLRVLTARPSDEELAQAPHALYGHVPPSHVYSVAQWLADVARVLGEARAARRVPIIVGGTGLYFKALLEGLSPVPPVPDDVRRHWRAEAARLGAPALHAVLAERDPVMADRLLPSDPQRIVRALEVLESTGRSLAAWQAIAGEPVLASDSVHRLCLRPERAWLQARCDMRFDEMMETGALDEVRTLATLALDPKLPVMGALGVKPLLLHRRGALPLVDAIAEAKAETRRYIKRQETWFNRNMIAWNNIKLEQYNNLKDYSALIVQN